MNEVVDGFMVAYGVGFNVSGLTGLTMGGGGWSRTPG